MTEYEVRAEEMLKKHMFSEDYDRDIEFLASELELAYSRGFAQGFEEMRSASMKIISG